MTATAPTATRTTAPLLPPTTSRPLAARVGLGVLQGVLAAVFLFSASGKVTLDPTVVAGFAAMGFGTAGTVVIGILESLGAVGLLVPRLSGLAAWALVALMIGATIATVLVVGGAMVAAPGVTLVLVTVVAVVRRHEVGRLARSLHGPRR